MGYLGTKPANSPLTSELIPDGLINTSDLANGAVTLEKMSQKLTTGTAQASTSGTSIDFTGIPSWAKRITVMFNGISTNGTSTVQIQLGSSSFSTTGYSSNASFGASSSSWYIFITTGFAIEAYPTAAQTRSGVYQFNLINNNTWVGTGTTGVLAGQVCYACAGNSPTLSGVLDRVRITTINGTDAFDAGTINIMYEG
jgi:hypothetical protein